MKKKTKKKNYVTLNVRIKLDFLEFFSCEIWWINLQEDGDNV